ncbi:MAG: hypothetical protein EAZ42_04090 [Verrucomicrobia bacterium]|nr:MAG: hypothetical protein EAZ42_04090 [Verrucomicrobiota bacterium]
MKSLIYDFLHRWRWLFVISVLISLVSSIGGKPLIFAPAAIFALAIDAQRGVFRAVRPLPISQLDQAKAWWVVGVPLQTLLSVPALVLGVFLFQQIHPNAGPAGYGPAAKRVVEATPPMEKSAEAMSGTSASVPEGSIIPPPKAAGKKPPVLWFAAGVQAWVALGYAGFCFFLMQWERTRPAENLAEIVQHVIATSLSSISMLGVVFLFIYFPRSPDAMVTWHWAILVAAPVFVALSYFSAAELLRRRMLMTAVKTRPQAAAKPGVHSRGLTGIPLFVVTFIGRIAMVVSVTICVWIVTSQWISKGDAPGTKPDLGGEMRVWMLCTILGVFMVESIGMRALRILPLSTPKFALLLLLIPWTVAFSGAIFSAVILRAGDPALSVWWNLTAHSLVLCGWVTLAYAITMHMSKLARLFVLPMISTIPYSMFHFVVKYPMPIAAVGFLAGLGGFALLVRGLRKSSAFYRQRGFFGTTAGQPTAVR